MNLVSSDCLATLERSWLELSSVSGLSRPSNAIVCPLFGLCNFER